MEKQISWNKFSASLRQKGGETSEELSARAANFLDKVKKKRSYTPYTERIPEPFEKDLKVVVTQWDMTRTVGEVEFRTSMFTEGDNQLLQIYSRPSTEGEFEARAKMYPGLLPRGLDDPRISIMATTKQTFLELCAHRSVPDSRRVAEDGDFFESKCELTYFTKFWSDCFSTYTPVPDKYGRMRACPDGKRLFVSRGDLRVVYEVKPVELSWVEVRATGKRGHVAWVRVGSIEDLGDLRTLRAQLASFLGAPATFWRAS